MPNKWHANQHPETCAHRNRANQQNKHQTATKTNKPAISKPIRILPSHQISYQEARSSQKGRRQGRSLKIISSSSNCFIITQWLISHFEEDWGGLARISRKQRFHIVTRNRPDADTFGKHVTLEHETPHNLKLPLLNMTIYQVRNTSAKCNPN